LIVGDVSGDVLLCSIQRAMCRDSRLQRSAAGLTSQTIA